MFSDYESKTQEIRRKIAKIANGVPTEQNLSWIHQAIEDIKVELDVVQQQYIDDGEDEITQIGLEVEAWLDQFTDEDNGLELPEPINFPEMYERDLFGNPTAKPHSR